MNIHRNQLRWNLYDCGFLVSVNEKKTLKGKNLLKSARELAWMYAETSSSQILNVAFWFLWN